MCERSIFIVLEYDYNEQQSVEFISNSLKHFRDYETVKNAKASPHEE